VKETEHRVAGRAQDLLACVDQLGSASVALLQ